MQLADSKQSTQANTSVAEASGSSAFTGVAAQEQPTVKKPTSSGKKAQKDASAKKAIVPVEQSTLQNSSKKLRAVDKKQSPHVNTSPAEASGSSTFTRVTAQKQTTVKKPASGLPVGSVLLKKSNKGGPKIDLIARGIKQAPLLSGSIVAAHMNDLVPQYGLLGSLVGAEDVQLPESQIYSNPTVPFAAFICGVQGSGKSHTTACLLENSMISSRHIGRIQESTSSLVFNYGDFGNGGRNFSVSEAAYLAAAAPGPEFVGHHAKKVTVFYSPSNPAMKTIYERLTNVKALPFYLNPKSLSITAMHKLMVVDDKASTPLYLANVEAILRKIATANVKNNPFDYLDFKNRLKQEDFSREQRNSLNQRIKVLDSFLDLKGTAKYPTHAPGEMTIMDLSDEVTTSSTACALFKISMDDFLSSPAKGKMVVLDEAHKYMLNTPGSHYFTEGITRAIREQRHDGVRVIISTQEPTVANDLIALCSITVMHRFTSPAWYAALKRHIGAMEDENNVMQQVEELDTGEALVYAPSAVLGKNEDGGLIKGTGQLLKIDIRRRVTRDGGESVLAV